MKQNDTTNVMAGKFKSGGYAFRAPLGTTLPTDASTALDGAFKNLGFLSPDGLKQAPNEESAEFVDVNGDVVYTTVTKQGVELSCAFLESLRPEVLKMAYGDENITVTEKSGSDPTKITVKTNSKGRELASYIFEVLMDGKATRIVIPKGKIKEVGEVTYKSDELISYPVTISCLPDEHGDKVISYIHLDDAEG